MRSVLVPFLLPLSAFAESGMSSRAPFRSICGTHATPEVKSIAASFALEDAAEFASVSDSGTSLISSTPLQARIWTRPNWIPKKGITVKTYFHVLASSKNVSEGWVPNAQLKEQFKVLNDDYAPHKIKFELLEITRTINANWSYDGDEYGMKKKLRKGDYKSLNVYFQEGTYDGSFGYAKFPTTAPKGSWNFTVDGVNILQCSLPGGACEGFNLGKTLVHEAGHWFGLFHVFNDYINQVCEEPGDYVADTPMQASPSFGCPVGKDSCTEPGLDSIHNYMDYSDDPCYEEFTPLQAKRMYTFWFNYRDIKRKGTWWD